MTRPAARDAGLLSRRRRAALGLLLGLLACREAAAPPRAVAPATPRAALVLEPPRIGVGQVATLERVVVTPPGHTPRPFVPPPAIDGLWLLGSEALPPVREPTRWVHRTQIRLRARATGDFVFPGGEVEVEAPDGSVSRLPLADLPIEVTSLLREHPDRRTPFGARAAPPSAREPGSVIGPALTGAGTALALVWLWTLARRRRSGAGPEAPARRPPPVAPWESARDEIESSRARAAEGRPFEAAHLLACALRRYASRRFEPGVAALTTEEIAAREPPFAARSRWPELLELLQQLDALRFLPEQDARVRTRLATRLPALCASARAFVDASLPAGAAPPARDAAPPGADPGGPGA